MPGPVPEAPPEDAPAATAAVVFPSEEQRRQAEELTAEISDQNLRKVVRKAAELSLARAADGRPF